MLNYMRFRFYEIIQFTWEYLQKLHEPVFDCLKQEGQLSVIFADDSYVMSEKC